MNFDFFSIDCSIGTKFLVERCKMPRGKVCVVSADVMSDCSVNPGRLLTVTDVKSFTVEAMIFLIYTLTLTLNFF